MSRLFRLGLTVALMVYPLYVWWAITQLTPIAAILPLAVLALLRGLLTLNQPNGTHFFYILTAILLVVALLLRQAEYALLFYPFWINVGMLALFAWTLLSPPSFVTRIATLLEGSLDAKGVTYTTKVTMVWCGFFILNGSIAMGTALYADWDLWALYNGLISYLLMGLLMLIEWRIRCKIRASD